MEWPKGRGADTGRLSLRPMLCPVFQAPPRPPQTNLTQGTLPLSLTLTTPLGATALPPGVCEGLEFKNKQKTQGIQL